MQDNFLYSLLSNRATAPDYIRQLKSITNNDVSLINRIAHLGLMFPHLSNIICDQLPDRIDLSHNGMTSSLVALLQSGLPYKRIVPLIDSCDLLSRSHNDPDSKRALLLSLKISEPNVIYHDERLWQPAINRQHTARVPCTPSSLVVLDHLVQALESLQNAYDASLPILISGPGSCGKSSLIDAFVSTLPTSNLTRLFIDSGTDLKSLIGTYSCTEVAGQFRWVPGPIALAAFNGTNVVIEDLDRVPVDLIQSLRSLLECRLLTIPELGQTIQAHPNFRLFATRSTSTTSSFPLHALFAKITLPALSLSDLQQIISNQFESLRPHLHLILQTYATAIAANSAIGVRALLRLIRRLDHMQIPQRLTSHIREQIVQHVHVCLVINMMPSDARNQLSAALAQIWTIDDRRNHFILHEQVPETAPRTPSLAPTSFARRLLWRLSGAIEQNEPVLLVGETGNGKTVIIEELALQHGRRLVVVNLSQQTDPQDLIGGFKPIELKSTAIPILNQFASLFPKTFSRSNNVSFLQSIRKAFEDGRYRSLATMLLSCCEMALGRECRHSKQWVQLQDDVEKYLGQVRHHESGALSFGFVEGALTQALRNGDWILLDEINLASADALHCLSSLLESASSSLTLSEHGSEHVPRHDAFRLFACMNPPTDSCRRPLHPTFRQRFLVLFIDDVTEKNDLLAIVHHMLPTLPKSIDSQAIVDAYLKSREMALNHVLSSDEEVGERPTYSLRTLCRALKYAYETHSTLTLERALYEGLQLAFITPLDPRSRLLTSPMFDSIVRPERRRFQNQNLSDDFVEICGFPLRRGPNPIDDVIGDDFIVTETVSGRLRDLARVLAGSTPLPVLLQGPTSAGKTSLVEYLARRTGHRLIRINNHEHTDTTEYLGTYSTDPATGRLAFIEGALVRAVRYGYWLVLDELNLAPSQVLEALNRLLDDHRQLYIAETQETITAHPSFALFATQNPAGGAYGGRKVLSRAFRNRFIEIHVGDIPTQELAILLEKRGRMAPSHCRKIINVMIDLQKRRQQSRVFAGKSLITARDLFRWALRQPVTIDDIAAHGYLLFADRLRSAADREAVRCCLISNLKVKDLNPDVVYNQLLPSGLDLSSFGVALTSSMRRMLALCHAGLYAKEPILLVGDTGLGKTTVCQILAQAAGRHLHIVNVHEHTDACDLIGGLRPVRGRQLLLDQAQEALQRAGVIVNDVLDDGVLDRIVGDGAEAEAARTAVRQLNSLFEWADGPLVTAMKNGDWILIDEISLADDAVIERLNSVLELGRSLLLAEKSDADLIVAADSFRILATMNPSGDFGKKELSPALRNRFTEIWFPSEHSHHDLQLIINDLTNDDDIFNDQCRNAIFNFYIRYHDECVQNQRDRLSIRDLKSLISFIDCARRRCQLSISMSFIHGVLLNVIDGLGIGTQASSLHQRRSALQIALDSIQDDTIVSHIDLQDCCISMPSEFMMSKDQFGLDPFWISSGPNPPRPTSFSTSAPSTRRNLIRVLRAMQLKKPILLEGSPGVGKTSLITSLGSSSGHDLIRINLSEQTDMMDLLGSDLPDPDGRPGRFQWSPGPFLQAIINGYWVLLDELNLASQTVLEGLNAVLDHRATVFVPELSRSFQCHESFRVFACQNPVHEGGGRKSLPASFLNRFTKVHLEEMTRDDLDIILQQTCPGSDPRLIEFNNMVHHRACVVRDLGQIGAPWEFNIRDVFRWAQISSNKTDLGLDLVYLQRFRSSHDRDLVTCLYENVFNQDPIRVTHPLIDIKPDLITFTDLKSGLVRQYPRSCSVPTDNCLLLQGMSGPLLHLSEAILSNMPAVIIGASCSGKTSLVRLLSQLYQHPLYIFPVTTTLDANELLGSFEQIDLGRCRKRIWDLVRERLQWAASRDQLTATTMQIWDAIQLRQDRTECNREEVVLLSQLNSCLQLGIDQDLNQLEDLVVNGTAGRFQWVDGIVVRAIKEGAWLLLDNANLCSNSVLDRLNSLLEPERILMLNENGVGERIVAHPQFRLFLTSDDQYGQLSRAIRNRCVEIALINDDKIPEHDQWHHRYTDHDLIRLIMKSGISWSPLAHVMLHTHEHLLQQDHHGRIQLYSLLHWAQLASGQVRRGAGPIPALVSALKQVYDVSADDIKQFCERCSSLSDDLVAGPYNGFIDIDVGERLHQLIGFWTTPSSTLMIQSQLTMSLIPRHHHPTSTRSLSIVVQHCPRQYLSHLQQRHTLLHSLLGDQLPRYPIWNEFLTSTNVWTSMRSWTGTNSSQCLYLGLLIDGLVSGDAGHKPVLMKYRPGSGPDVELLSATLISLDNALLQSHMQDITDLSQCWRLRDRLRQAVKNISQWTESDLGSVHIICRDLIKLIPSEWHHLRALLQKLASASCGGSNLSTSNRFWKMSGRPQLPTNSDLAQLRANILQLDHREDMTSIDPDLRRTLVEALSTCYAYHDLPDQIPSLCDAVRIALQSGIRRRCQSLCCSSSIDPGQTRSPACADSFTIRVSGADHDEDAVAVEEEIEIDPPSINTNCLHQCGRLVNAFLRVIGSRLLADQYGDRDQIGHIAADTLDLALQYPSRSCYDLEPFQTLSWSGQMDVHIRHRLERGHLSSILRSGHETASSTIIDNVLRSVQTPLRRRQHHIDTLNRLVQLHWKCNSRSSVAVHHHNGNDVASLTSALLAVVSVFCPSIKDLGQIADVYSSKDERFVQVMRWFLTPLLEAIECRSVQSGWVLLRAIRLHLVAPSSALDPALKYDIRARHAQYDLNQIENHLDLHRLTYRYLTGTDYHDHHLINTEHELSQQLDRARSRLVIRCEPGHFALVYARIQTMLATLASAERILLLVSMNLNDDDREHWLESAETFVMDIQSTSIMYSYEDVLSPVLIELMRICTLIRSPLPSSKSTINQIVTLHDQSGDIIDRLCSGSGLNLSAIKLIVSHLSESPRSQARSDRLKIALGGLVRIWNRLEERRREKAADAEQLYRFKESGGVAPNDEQRRQNLHDALFPSFREDIADIIPDINENPFAADDNHETTTEPECIERLHDIDLVEIFEFYLRSLPTRSSPSYTDQDLSQARSRAVLALLDKYRPDLTDDSALWLTCCDLIQGQIRDLTQRRPNQDDSVNQGVFAEASVSASELEPLQVVITALLRRLRDLLNLDECRGHPTLISCVRICSRLMSLPITSSILRLCACSEQILAEANKWQQFAAKYVSLENELKPLWALVVRWRKMELECWRQALSGRDQAVYRRAVRLWPHLIQLISTYDQHDPEEVFIALDQFIHTASAGELPVRLQMMSSLTEIAHGPVRDLVQNLAAFYTIVMERSLKPHFDQSRKQTETDLVNLTRMVRWDLANYHALRQSCQKSHNQLVHALDKYDDILNQPAGRYLIEYQERFQRPDLIWSCQIKDDMRDVMKGPSPQRRLARNMLYLMKKSLPDLCHVGQHIRSEAEQILERARDLRHGNGSLLRKKKALSDTMKLMREVGLRHHQSAIKSTTHIDTSSLAAIFRTTALSRYESQFLDLIELIRSLRRAVTCHHSDLTSIEAQRCLGLLEHMFAMIISCRTRLSEIGHELEHISRWTNNITQLHISSGTDRIDLDKLVSVQDQVIPALQYATRIYTCHDNGIEMGVDMDHVRECERLLAAVRRDRDLLEQIPTNDIRSKYDSEHVHECIHTLHLVHNLLPQLPFSASFNNLSNRLQSYLAAPIRDQSHHQSDKDADDVITTLKLLAERVHRLPGPGPSWTDTQQYIMNMITCHDIQRVLAHLHHTQWSSTSTDQLTDIEECLHVVQYVHEVQYEDLYDLYASLISLATCSATILNTIFRQGFCRRVDQAEGDDEGDEVADGTGMGEGIGHNDVSDQLDNEDQLLGLQSDQHEQSNDQPNESVQETEPGMEMENDFQGDVHDVDNNQEKNEGDDDNDDDDQGPELDKQMSDNNVNNDEVVDERLWDHDLDQESERDQNQDQKNNTGDPNEISAKQDRPDKSDSDKQDDKSRPDNNTTNNEEPDPNNMDDNMEECEPAQEEENPINGNENHDNHDINQADLELPENLNLDEAMECDGDDIDDDGEDHDDMDGGSDPNADLTDHDDNVDDDTAGADAQLPPQQPDLQQMNNEGFQPDCQEQVSEMDGDDVPLDDDEEEQHTGVDNELKASCDEQPECADRPANSNSDMNQDMMDDDDVNADGDQTGSHQVNDNNGQIRPITSSGADGDHQKQQQKRRPESEWNPLRSLADAQEHWKRKCEVLEESAAELGPEPAEDPNRQLNDLAQHVSDEMAADGAALAASADPFQVDEDQEQTSPEQETSAPDQGESVPDLEEEPRAPDDELSPDKAPLNKQRKRRPQQDSAVNEAQEANRNDDNENEMQIGSDSSLNQISQVIRPTSMGDDIEPDRSEPNSEYEMRSDKVTGLSEQEERRWQELCSATSDLSSALCEQLRIMLEPQIASSLGGAFRSGKRLSIRRVISYIASSYRHDRIWLRRCRPSRRSYDIAIAIDDSLSMRETGAGTMALQSLTILATALNRLEAGNLSVLRFGAGVDLLSKSFTITEGARITSSFSFSESETCFSKVLQSGLDLFDQARQTSSIELQHNQLMFVISDARIQQDRPNIARLLRRAALNDQFVVLVVIDSADEAASIVNMKSVSYPNGRLQVDDYLTDFPFPFYIILRRTSDLPVVVADALRQWIELVQRQ